MGKLFFCAKMDEKQRKILYPIVCRWQQMIKTITKEWLDHKKEDHKDLPYWYNEPCNVSIFAGACWLEGYYCISECSLEKSYKDEISNHIDDKKQEKGRRFNDLYFHNDEVSVYVEAKQVRASYSDNTFKNIDDKFNELKTNDFATIRGHIEEYEPDAMKLMLVFHIPYWSEKKEFDQEKFISDYIDKLKTNENYDFAAWYITDECPKLNDNSWYPIVVLIGKIHEWKK